MEKYIANLIRLFPALIMMFAASTSTAKIIHVPGQQPTIKAGIVLAQENDTVMVSAGTYIGAQNRDLDFGGKAIVLKSMKGATLTIINCQGSSFIPHRGFRIHQGEDSTTVIEGFTIINGFAPPAGPASESIGGGILCENGSSPTVRDCVFYDNYAANGGGALAFIEGSSPRVSGCTFVDNTALHDTGATNIGYGGAIRCEKSEPIFRNCIFNSNRANIGGGMSCSNSNVIVESCEFSSNIAEVYVTFEPAGPGYGGGLHLDSSSIMLDYCVFDRNAALTGNNMSYATAEGGAIYAYRSMPTLINCTMYGNQVEEYGEGMPGRGAGIFLLDSPAEIHNSIIAYGLGGEGIACPYNQAFDTIMLPNIGCTDIHGNQFGDWTDSLAFLADINGNFSSPPYFCKPEVGDLNLWAYSPCIPDSNQCRTLIGARGIGCLTDVDEEASPDDMEFSLSQNRPNPFNLSTIIEYHLPRKEHVTITVYNTLGQEVRNLVRAEKSAGKHYIQWDGRDDNSRTVASGLYFYVLRGESTETSRAMILLK